MSASVAARVDWMDHMMICCRGRYERSLIARQVDHPPLSSSARKPSLILPAAPHPRTTHLPSIPPRRPPFSSPPLSPDPSAPRVQRTGRPERGPHHRRALQCAGAGAGRGGWRRPASLPRLLARGQCECCQYDPGQAGEQCGEAAEHARNDIRSMTKTKVAPIVNIIPMKYAQ